MAKLREISITKKDIDEYLKTYSDFSFEVKVLSHLVELGFSCKHSGTYSDPITSKTREFDIRAVKEVRHDDNFIFRLCLSVECKNVRDNFPILVHCLPRRSDESYQDLIWSSRESNKLPVGLMRYGFRLRLDGENSVYEQQNPVGKSCDQVGRRQDGEVIGTDSDVFDKISQSINASYEMIRKAHYTGDENTVIVSNVLPVLVVPKDRLWSVCYDNAGNICKDVSTTSRVPYYIGKSWSVGDLPEIGQTYYTSHLEIVELDALGDLAIIHMSPERFSRSRLYQTLRRRKN